MSENNERVVKRCLKCKELKGKHGSCSCVSDTLAVETTVPVTYHVKQ